MRIHIRTLQTVCSFQKELVGIIFHVRSQYGKQNKDACVQKAKKERISQGGGRGGEEGRTK